MQVMLACIWAAARTLAGGKVEEGSLLRALGCTPNPGLLSLWQERLGGHEPAGSETCPCRESGGKVGQVVLAWTPLGTGWSLGVSLEEHRGMGWESGCARGSRAAGADVKHVHA